MRKIAIAIALLLGACSASGTKSKANGGSSGAGGSAGASGAGGNGFDAGPNGGADAGGNTGVDPKTCAEAAATRSYVGCDFWAATLANSVWSVFDYAVIVANAGTTTAHITVARNGGTIHSSVAPDSLVKLYLPWVPEVKGPDGDACTMPVPLTASIHAKNAAYHLTSTVPVTVYQFNALEYKPSGGPPKKDWSSCPGYKMCTTGAPHMVGCYSYSNDASLLLPSTALTGTYRVTGLAGQQISLNKPNGAYVAIIGTEDNTTVKVKVSATGDILAGADVKATTSGGVATLTVNAADVVELVSTYNKDLSGSLVQADKPVEVISGMPCKNIPTGAGDCDHVEESVFPAETLGKHYFVVPPTGPTGNVPGQVVRLVGNVDGTHLTYPGTMPAKAPVTINAGQLVDLGVVKDPFEIEGDHAFSIETFMEGSSVVDPTGHEGDPSMSVATSVEQYRKKYVFLAPNDYDTSYVDIVVPDGANVKVDGTAVPTPTPISSHFGVSRVQLGTGKNGAHVLVSDKPVGIQVAGYGKYTSYQYPGGSNLMHIAPAPPR